MKQSLNGTFRLVVFIVFAAFSMEAMALDIIGPARIIYDTDNSTATFFGTPEQTADGIFNNPPGTTNGFAYAPLDASISYHFDQSYNLTSLVLQGQVGGDSAEAVREFRIVFYNQNNDVIGAPFLATHTDASAPETFDLTAGGYDNVRSFSFWALTRQDGGTANTELSEIQFVGEAAAAAHAVPTLGEWGLLFVMALLAVTGLVGLSRQRVRL